MAESHLIEFPNSDILDRAFKSLKKGSRETQTKQNRLVEILRNRIESIDLNYDLQPSVFQVADFILLVAINNHLIISQGTTYQSSKLEEQVLKHIFGPREQVYIAITAAKMSEGDFVGTFDGLLGRGVAGKEPLLPMSRGTTSRLKPVDSGMGSKRKKPVPPEPTPHEHSPNPQQG